MKYYNGGTEVRGGYYWDTQGLKIETIDGELGSLQNVGGKYVKIPMLLIVPMALVMSLSFVIFLPFVGFVMLFYALWKRIVK